MKTLYEIIKSLQTAQGTLEKQAIMEAHKDNELFKAYMKATYDVGLNYYQKKAPTPSKYFDYEFDEHSIVGIVYMLDGRKVTGNAAKEWLKREMELYSPEDQELIGLMIARSIGAGVGDKIVLSTWPDLYFIPPYMRAASMDEKVRERFSKLSYWLVEEKRDGSFAYLRKHGADSSQAITRQGTIYPAWFSNRLSEGLQAGWTLMGEMEVYKDGKLMSRKEGNGVLNSVAKGADESEFDGYVFSYVAWDTVTDEEFFVGRSELPLEIRKANLFIVIENAKQIVEVDSARVDSIAKAKAIHIQYTRLGKEGTVWKDPEGIWRDCSSGSKDMVKVKVVFEADFEITHTYEGTGKAKGMLGGIGIKTSCGKLKNNLGSGFTDEQRKALWAVRDTLPGMICTAEANDVISNRDKDTVSLSLGIFIELRYDKTEADSLERVYEQLNAAKLGKEMREE